MNSTVKVGDVVQYVNPVGQPTNALVTAVWTPTCINVVTVSDDTNETDTYGRQIKRVTSLSHKGQMAVHGNYWKLTEEELNPIAQPLEK